MDDHLAGVHWALVAHQRRNVHMRQEQCSVDLVNIGEDGKQGLWLLEAFSCEKSCAKDEP